MNFEVSRGLLVAAIRRSARGVGVHLAIGLFEGMMGIARAGTKWPHPLRQYGEWKGVFRRYRQWASKGMFDKMLETLAELAKRNTVACMIDRTMTWVHHCAGATEKVSRQNWALGRSRGGFTTKLHARCEAKGLSLGFVPLAGQAHDVGGLRCAVPHHNRPDRSLPG